MLTHVAVPARVVILLGALAAALGLAFFATSHLTGHSSAYLYRGVTPSHVSAVSAKPAYLYRG